MNREDILKGETLKEDNWSSSNPESPKNPNLKVIGWFKKSNTSSGNGYSVYLVYCSECAKDVELNGEGYYKLSKGDFLRGVSPCECSTSPSKRTKKQYEILLKRRCEYLGYGYIGMDSEKVNHKTSATLFCNKHGNFKVRQIRDFIEGEIKGCVKCTKENCGRSSRTPEEDCVASFINTGRFPEGTIFERIEDSTNEKPYISKWKVYCPACGETSIRSQKCLLDGRLPCVCGKMKQRFAYIMNLSIDDKVVALKFGVTESVSKRLKKIQSYSKLKVSLESVWEFETKSSCLEAEKLCLKTLLCGVVEKSQIRESTETTSYTNLDKIKDIYKNMGGVKL